LCGDIFQTTFTGAANSGAEFLWDFGPQGSITSASTTDVEDISFGAAGPQLITLSVTQNGCTQSASQFVNVVNPGFAGSVTTEPVACFGGNTGSASISVVGGQAPFQFQWSNGGNGSVVNDLSAAIYTVSVTDVNNCSFTRTAEVTQPTDIVFAGLVKPEGCAGMFDGMIQLVAVGGVAPYTYLWNTGETTYELLNIAGGTYSLTITDANGCSRDTSVVVVRYCEEGNADIPTVFTPGNGDGLNDVWVIPGIEYFPGNEVLIYNRWGGLVWSVRSYNNDNGWTGVDTNQNDLSSGAYYYLIFLNDPAETIFRGSVTIIR
jgi:gliding motility-associated-like protein